MSNVIILTSGTSYASQALSVGVGIPLKYVLPMYDYRYDPYVLSANIVPSSACEPVSAVSFFGEPLYNITNLPAYTYTMTNSKMILSAAGQSGTTTLTGNPFNNNSYMNLLNGKPISPLVSGSSMVYNGGTWSIAGYASVPVSGTLSSVSGYTYIKEIYHDVISYAPIVSSDGTGVGRGVYRVRLNNQIGQFKFNKLILYMAKYVNGVEDDTVDPVPAMVVSLDRPVIKSTNGSNVNYFEADIEVAVSASNYFSQVSYLNNSVFNQAGPGLVNYTGKVAIGSSAIPGSWEPRARLHLYSETGIEHLRMGNENFNYVNFTMGEQSSSRISMILDTSASKDVLLGVRGAISASDDIFAGGGINVSGDFFNPRVSIQADGVISTDGVIYTEYLEVYNTASFNNETTHNNNAKFYEGATLSTIITSGGTISAGGTDGSIYSRNVSTNSLEVVNNATFDRNTFHLDKMEFYNPLGERTIVITSAGVVSASNNMFAGGGINVSGDFFNPRVSIQADGVISTDGVIYTEYLEVYNTASFNNETTHNNNAKFYEGATLSTIITSGGTISAGGTDGAIYSRYLYASDYAHFGTYAYAGELDVGGQTTLNTLNVSGVTTMSKNLAFETSAGIRTKAQMFTISGGPHGATIVAGVGDATMGLIMLEQEATSNTSILVYTSAAHKNNIVLVTPLCEGVDTDIFCVWDRYSTVNGSYMPIDIWFGGTAVSPQCKGISFMIIRTSDS